MRFVSESEQRRSRRKYLAHRRARATESDRRWRRHHKLDNGALNGRTVAMVTLGTQLDLDQRRPEPALVDHVRRATNDPFQPALDSEPYCWGT